MPSKSPAQARLMAAVAHGWKPSGIKGPPVKVAKEFNQADKGTGIRQGKAMGGPMSGAPNQIQPQLAALRARMPQPGGMLNRGPIPPPSAAVRPPMAAGMPAGPPGSALAGLRQPMPMQGAAMRPMMARGGMLQPPGGLGPQAYTPKPSPLASLIGNRFAAMHRGNPAGIRKPRIPLPGALRNINQNSHATKESLGPIGLS